MSLIDHYVKGGPSISIPVRLLSDIYNSISEDNSQIKAVIIEYLKDYKKNIEEKGHVAEGFRLEDEGILIFDEALYDEAVYRGKIETYSRDIFDRMNKLKSCVELFRHMGESHQEALANITGRLLDQRIGEGEDISQEQMDLLERVLPDLKKLTDSIK